MLTMLEADDCPPARKHTSYAKNAKTSDVIIQVRDTMLEGADASPLAGADAPDCYYTATTQQTQNMTDPSHRREVVAALAAADKPVICSRTLATEDQ